MYGKQKLVAEYERPFQVYRRSLSHALHTIPHTSPSHNSLMEPDTSLAGERPSTEPQLYPIHPDKGGSSPFAFSLPPWSSQDHSYDLSSNPTARPSSSPHPLSHHVGYTRRSGANPLFHTTFLRNEHRVSSLRTDHKRTRKLLTCEQSRLLETVLERVSVYALPCDPLITVLQTFYPSTALREAIARKLRIHPRKVQIWFQNKRQGHRRYNTETQFGQQIDANGLRARRATWSDSSDPWQLPLRNHADDTVRSYDDITIRGLVDADGRPFPELQLNPQWNPRSSYEGSALSRFHHRSASRSVDEYVYTTERDTPLSSAESCYTSWCEGNRPRSFSTCKQDASPRKVPPSVNLHQSWQAHPTSIDTLVNTTRRMHLPSLTREFCSESSPGDLCSSHPMESKPLLAPIRADSQGQTASTAYARRATLPESRRLLPSISEMLPK